MVVWKYAIWKFHCSNKDFVYPLLLWQAAVNSRVWLSSWTSFRSSPVSLTSVCFTTSLTWPRPLQLHSRSLHSALTWWVAWLSFRLLCKELQPLESLCTNSQDGLSDFLQILGAMCCILVSGGVLHWWCTCTSNLLAQLSFILCVKLHSCLLQ